MSGKINLPDSSLPDTAESLKLAEMMRGQGMDIFKRGAAPTSQMATMQPLLDAELMRIREQGTQAKGRAAGAAERRGLTFSDIALGQLGGIDVGMMQAEGDVRGGMLTSAMQQKQQSEAQELSFLMDQIASANAMAQSRDQADIARSGGMAQMGAARDFYNMQAKQADEQAMMKMLSQGLGMAGGYDWGGGGGGNTTNLPGYGNSAPQNPSAYGAYESGSPWLTDLPQSTGGYSSAPTRVDNRKFDPLLPLRRIGQGGVDIFKGAFYR